MVSPTLSAQAGEVRHKFAAAASANSLLESLVSGPGQAKSQAEDTLSLCLQAHAALVLLGLMRSSAFAKTFALVHSIASTTHRYIKQLFLVLGTRLAQFKRYCSVVKCVLDGPLDTHI